jgi:hypothetical protein
MSLNIVHHPVAAAQERTLYLWQIAGGYWKPSGKTANQCAICRGFAKTLREIIRQYFQYLRHPNADVRRYGKTSANISKTFFKLTCKISGKFKKLFKICQKQVTV